MRRRNPERAAGEGAVGRRPSVSVRLLAIVVLVAVAGCTGGGGSDRPSATGGSGGGGEAPQGRRGGTLSMALLDPGPLDPARAEGLEDEVVLGNLFDGLTAIDPSGAVRPSVAASWTSDPGVRRWQGPPDHRAGDPRPHHPGRPARPSLRRPPGPGRRPPAVPAALGPSPPRPRRLPASAARQRPVPPGRPGP